MSSPRWTAALAVPVLLLALAAPMAQQERSDPGNSEPSDGQRQEPPRFRAEANFVRVDAYVTEDGVPVRDLTVEDFEVLEDGKPQKIETFEHVEVQAGGPQETRIEPETVRQGRALAEDPRARVFVLFLDTYHTDVAGSHYMQRAIVNMLDQLLGQDDVFAVMTPEMSTRDLAFARRTGTTAGMLHKYWTWGREGTIADFDPEELAYMSCYPDPPPVDTGIGCLRADYKGVAAEMIARRRERRTLSALNDLAVFLRDQRDERKAVITITSGWGLFLPDARLARKLSCDRVPGIPPIGVNPEGRITRDPETSGFGSQYECDGDRVMLAQIDNQQYFLDILDRANRSNVTFYPVDAQGLRSWNEHIGKQPYGQPAIFDQARLTGRIETLRTLAESTDGFAVVNTNDFDRGMRRIVDDLSSYYLLGYYTTNGKLDGKFRSIKVRVKRPGVEVRARRGYRAATVEEFETNREQIETTAAEAPPSAVQSAIDSLAGVRRGVRLFTQASWVAAPIDGPVDGTSHVWVVGEIDAATARSSEWAAGGEAELVITAEDEVTIATAKQAVQPAARVVTMNLPDVALGPGEYVLRLRINPTTPGIPLVDTLRFTVAEDGTPVGQPRLRRRGPTTGAQYVVTATPTFRRTERIRVEVPVLGGADTMTAELLDRNGKTMAVPVQSALKREEGGALTWAGAELNLAPLAPGEYVIRTSIQRGTDRREIMTAFRMVP
jgi:VWFA-related protein